MSHIKLYKAFPYGSALGRDHEGPICRPPSGWFYLNGNYGKLRYWPGALLYFYNTGGRYRITRR